MAAVAPDLRPRGAAELYDAAIHLCARGATPLPALSIFGAVLPAVSGLALGYRAIHGKPWLALAAVFSLALMLRAVFAGAASLAAEAALEGRPMGAGDALRRAFARAPSLMSAGGIQVLLQWAVIPSTLWLTLALWSPLYAATPLVARGEAGPFTMGSACRRRVFREPTFMLRLLHGLASLIVLANLHTGFAVALYLGRALLGLDVAFLDQFSSLANPIYDFFLLALAGIVLEPVKNALGVLLLVDARVRSEGLDLAAAADQLLSRRGKGAVAAVALLLALIASAPLAARAADDATVERLESLVIDLGLSGDDEVTRDFEAARRLEGADAVALRHFVERLERDYQAGVDEDELAERLREGLIEGREASALGESDGDPRELARSILARSEFEPPKERVVGEKEKDEKESWLISLLRRFFEWLRQHEPKDRQLPRRDFSFPGLGGGVFEIVTYVLVGAAVIALVWLLVRSVRRDPQAQAEPGEGGAGAGAGDAPDTESALARPPEGWWTEADRLAALGEFREAVRALYLAALAALHRRGAIEYDPARSNWDYVRAFRGGGEELPRFRDLTRRFDFVWYGRMGADPCGYANVRELAKPILEREVRADA